MFQFVPSWLDVRSNRVHRHLVIVTVVTVMIFVSFSILWMGNSESTIKSIHSFANFFGVLFVAWQSRKLEFLRHQDFISALFGWVLLFTAIFLLAYWPIEFLTGRDPVSTHYGKVLLAVVTTALLLMVAVLVAFAPRYFREFMTGPRTDEEIRNDVLEENE